jgi:progressive ankylosis protein
MMAVEGPFLAAVVARLPDPTFNLAAYGVAFAIAILVESPVIMLMSAATALVEDADSYRKLRNFAQSLNVLSTGLLLFVLIPPVFDVLMRTALGLPEPVTEIVYGSLWILLPWPAAIGYRRFLHGILIRAGRTRRVAYGTALRLVSMAATALVARHFGLPGAWVGAAALSAGVTIEAIAARFMAAETVRELLRGEGTGEERETPAEAAAAREAGAGATSLTGVERVTPGRTAVAPGLGYGAIARFYYPLALTSLIGLSVQPLLTFFMGRSPYPVESLALFPVVQSLFFLFTAIGLSYQEAAIALLGREAEHARALARFGLTLALLSSAGLATIAFTPLATFWFETISGLSAELAGMALTPTQVLVPLPALAVVISLQRAFLVQSRATRPITHATVVEIVGIAALFPLLGWGAGMMGVTAAMIALLGGRIAGVLFLAPRTLTALRFRR